MHRELFKRNQRRCFRLASERLIFVRLDNPLEQSSALGGAIATFELHLVSCGVTPPPPPKLPAFLSGLALPVPRCVWGDGDGEREGVGVNTTEVWARRQEQGAPGGMARKDETEECRLHQAV